MEIEFTTDAPIEAAASSIATTAAASSSAAPAAPAVAAAAAAPATPAARLESHLTTALHALYKSALIVEQGVAQPAPSAALDPQLERLMGIAQPAMKHADLTNQNLQRQVDVFLQSLQSIDHVGRELQLSVPKAVIDCMDHGENPSALTGRFIDDTRYANECVRAQIFATKMLHDQLALRMELWDQVLHKEAAEGNQGAKQLLRDSADTNDGKTQTTL